MKQIKCRIDDETWEKFKEMYPDYSARISQLINMDLDDKLPKGEGELTSWKGRKKH
jgi:antitoxin component of RelBE/YafQ-DinJ toxin-antitoxin module